MRENAFNCCVTAHAWRHVTLPQSCVKQVFTAVAWQQTRRSDATRWATRLGSARWKHRFVYCCVIAGACFDVTVLAWRKYATVSCIQFITYNIVTWFTVEGFGLVIEFIETLQNVTTINYTGNANSHTLQFIRARTKSSQSVLYSPVVAW
jgi:hypothetical protein